MNDRQKIADWLVKQDTRLRWVFAGDSITHGALHTFGQRDYVQHFEERLRYELRRPGDYVIRTAASGWNLNTLIADIEASVLQFAPQVVSINMGMNEASNGLDGLEDFRSGYTALVHTIRRQTGAALIIHTPNTIDPADTERGPYLSEYAAAVHAMAVENDTVLVDHFTYWQQARKANVKRQLYWLNDAIHPNEYGHRAMAHLLIRELGLWDEQSLVCRLLVPE